MNINTISLPWCLGRQGQPKKNEEEKEETNIHQPFFVQFRPKDFCEKNAAKSHKLGRNLFSKIAIFIEYRF